MFHPGCASSDATSLVLAGFSRYPNTLLWIVRLGREGTFSYEPGEMQLPSAMIWRLSPFTLEVVQLLAAASETVLPVLACSPRATASDSASSGAAPHPIRATARRVVIAAGRSAWAGIM